MSKKSRFPKVRLIKEITPELPHGTVGEIIDDRDPDKHWMVYVRWVGGMVIPMYSDEIQKVQEGI